LRKSKVIKKRVIRSGWSSWLENHKLKMFPTELSGERTTNGYAQAAQTKEVLWLICKRCICDWPTNRNWKLDPDTSMEISGKTSKKGIFNKFIAPHIGPQ